MWPCLAANETRKHGYEPSLKKIKDLLLWKKEKKLPSQSIKPQLSVGHRVMESSTSTITRRASYGPLLS
jgi:hypothetical protein